MTGLEIDDLEPTTRGDFRRANGAPQVIIEGKNQRFSRPSNWGKVLDDENALVNWKLNKAIKGTADRPELAAQALAVTDDDRPAWKELREKAINAGRGNQAADIGTAIHAMSERWEQDDTYDPGQQYTPILESYTNALTELGLVSMHFEQQVVNVEYRAAGTCDRFYRLMKDLTAPNGDILPAGTLIAGDLKTGKSLDLSGPGYTIQLAIYAQGRFYDVIHDQFMETPEINQDWGVLIKLNADGCEIVWCDLEAGNYGAWLVTEVRDWRKKWKNGTYSLPAVGAPASIPSPAEEISTTTAPDTTALDVEPSVDEWMGKMLPFVKRRLKALPEAARTWIQFRWPVDLPPPNKIEQAMDITRCLDLLDRAEAEFGCPWPSDDPRVVPGVHKDALIRTNQPPGSDSGIDALC